MSEQRYGGLTLAELRALAARGIPEKDRVWMSERSERLLTALPDLLAAAERAERLEAALQVIHPACCDDFPTPCTPDNCMVADALAGFIAMPAQEGGEP